MTAVAAEAGLSWRTVMGLVSATVAAVPDPDAVPVPRLAVVEHRFRSLRFVKLAGVHVQMASHGGVLRHVGSSVLVGGTLWRRASRL